MTNHWLDKKPTIKQLMRSASHINLWHAKRRQTDHDAADAYEYYVTLFAKQSADLQIGGWRIVAKEALKQLDTHYAMMRYALERCAHLIAREAHWKELAEQAYAWRESVEALAAERDQLLAWRESVINAYPDAEDIQVPE